MPRNAEKRPRAREAGALREGERKPPAASAPARPGVYFYAALFLVTMATLMLEILLTRIFSVILWYHFAFVAISVALFGMTLGAVIVHLAPEYFSGPAIARRLAGASWLFGLTTAVGLVALLTLRFAPPNQGSELGGLIPLYLLVSVPFTFSGIVVSVALTRFPGQVNRLYAADLIGAAVGCTAVILALDFLDAPSAVVAVGGAAAMGALLFALEARSCSLGVMAAALAVGLLGLAVGNAHHPVLRLRWVKGARALPYVYERWNAFSRITIDESSDVPFVWGGSRYPRSFRIEQLGLFIDATALTVLTRFDGDLAKLGYLPYDISAAAHWMRPHSKVLVIGVGGGRDVLTALTMKQDSVVGIELNDAIIEAVNDRFGDFTGHLDRLPNVRFVNDEARSWIDRSAEKFDIIQCSLIDTWAATAAGAFVLSENGLYTQQAWFSILRHLNDRGIFTVTRWYYYVVPGEIMRCLSLARASLEQLGVRDVRRHIAVVRCIGLPQAPGLPPLIGTGTVLVSRAPFNDEDLRRLDEYVRTTGLELVLSPQVCKVELFDQLLSAPKLRDFTDSFALDVSPPTDDRPFFFHMLRLRDWAKPQASFEQGMGAMNLQAVSVLGQLLDTTIALALLFIAVPLGLTYWRDRYSLRALLPGMLFFAAIGLGFMLVEISQMQRLIIYLGHPVYGLSVVLFGLLGASGLGALVAGGMRARIGAVRGPAALMAGLVVLLALFGLITPMVIEAARGWPTTQRVLLGAALLVPIGFLMGAPFPLGMKLASQIEGSPTAWYWGINGAMSVVASVAATALALTVGINAAFFIGVGCYVAAAACLLMLGRSG